MTESSQMEVDPVMVEYVTDRKVIAKAYLEGWFLIDLMSTLPYGLFLGGTS